MRTIAKPTILLLLALAAGLLWPRLGSVSATGVASVDAGYDHTCALTTGGGLKCWGDNGFGQLGDGTLTRRTKPVDVLGLGDGVAAVAADGAHTCALTKTGGVKCWGYNNYGQLGDGTTLPRSTPADVSGLSNGVSAVAAGGDRFGSGHSCVVTSMGGIRCWGLNRAGQLGNGATSSDATPLPVDVVGLPSGAAAITAGRFHTCALTTVGGAKCWGENAYGQVGDGTSLNQRPTPVDVVGLISGVASIGAGFRHTCAVTTAGGVRCWGYNSSGQLGDGTTMQRTTSVDVVGLTSGVAAIAIGGFHTCALTSAGGVKCWGLNASGQLGDGTAVSSTAPVDVIGLTSGVAAIAAGGEHTCALTKVGELKCWGENGSGQLGDGMSSNERYTPVDVVGFSPKPVGGIADLPHKADTRLDTPDPPGSSAGLLAVVATGVIAGAIVLGGAAWYARRRWLRC